MRAGVILYALTPCTGWYLIFTGLAEGDVAWGVSPQPWNLVLQIALLPEGERGEQVQPRRRVTHPRAQGGEQAAATVPRGG